MSERIVSKLSKTYRALLLAPLSILSLYGCASIIGLDDYTVAKGSAGATSGGTGGKGGAGGKGGSASGAAGEPDEGGAAGTPGAAGIPEAAGAAGAAGAENVPESVGCDGKTSFPANPQIVRSCLLRAGCDPSFTDPIRTISTCVTYNTQDALPGEKCNLTSQTCKDFEDCEHIGVAHDDLCGGTAKTGTRCQGDLAINCDNYDGDNRFFDCKALGGTCGTLTFSGTLYTDCKLDVSPDSCASLPNSDQTNFCHSGGGTKDDLRYYCWDGQAFGASCSSLATCIDTPDSPSTGGAGGGPAVGNATCYFDLDSCKGGDSAVCNNGVATLCSKGSQFKYNCGSIGLSCGVDSGSVYCLAPGCKAADVDSKCEESCSDDGSSLTFCYGGAPETLKCADYGFTQCLSDYDKVTGLPYAACRF